MDMKDDSQLAIYIYKTINDLMKMSLDMGTLLSRDDSRLRAYKEQIKKNFRNKWEEMAQFFEELGVIQPCPCTDGQSLTRCDICKGSRYVPTTIITSSEILEVETFVTSTADESIKNKLKSAPHIDFI